MRTKAWETWVDTAKGIAIILVVLFHSILFLDDVGLAGPWALMNTALDTFRMPLFFFTAGLFAARSIGLPLSVLWREKMARMFWLYALWSLIWALAFQIIPWVRTKQSQPELFDWLLIWVWPNTSTWFVYAIALYFFGAWVLRRLPLWAQLGIAGLVSVVTGADLVNTGNTALDKMGMYFVFFLVAVHFGPLCRRLANRTTWQLAIGSAAVYLLAAYAVASWEATTIPGVRLAVSALALVAGVSGAVILSRLRTFAFLQTLGQHTLTIYLLHFYPVLIAAALLQPVAGNPTLQAWSPVIAPALSTVAILLVLAISPAAQRVPGLFSLPGFVAPRNAVAR